MSRSILFCAVILTAASPYALPADSNGAAVINAATIQAIREYALSYSKTLPNFLCTLTTQHVSRPPNAVNNPNVRSAVIVEQLSLLNNKELRKTVRVEEEDRDSIHGPLSQGEFGTLLLTIFDPARGTGLKWSRVATLDSHKVDVLTYHVQQSSGYVLTQSTGELQVPFEGSVYADRQTHAVLRIQAKCTEIPLTAEYRFLNLTLDYGPAKVAGREYILPSRFVLDYMNSRQDRQNLNSGRFSAYREFSADTSIYFDGDKQ